MNLPTKFIAIGDIHIFNNKRFDEHEYVFSQFYELLDLEKPDFVIIIGDLVDSKLRLSPDQITLCRKFLLEISNRCPIIMIPGNHDLSLNTPDRLDSLTPIVNSLSDSIKNEIHYLKKSDIYSIYNINWAVWSCIENQKKPDFSKIVSGPIIGLYHGVVSGAISDTGFALSGGIEISEFNECDLVIMSDIHMQQSFRNNEINYTGSLIQVSVSESSNGSCLVYNLINDKYIPEVKQIKNIYSTLTIDPTNLSVNVLPTQKLRIKFDDTLYGRTQIADLARELKTKHNVPVNFAPIIQKKKAIFKSVSDNEITNENVFDYLENFIKKHSDRLDIKDVNNDLIRLKELDKEFGAGATIEYEEGDYSITKFEVTNFLSFGLDTVTIPMTDEGLVGIFGKNRVGKSSIIKALQYAKFNELPANSTAFKAINKYNRNKPASIKVFFTKLSKDYVIERILLPDVKNKSVKYDLKFYEIDTDGSIKNNLTKESRPFTETEIRKYLGINETFEMLSLFSAQKRQTEFIDCKNADRLKLVNKFLGLQPFEIKEKAVLDVLKEKNAVYVALMRQFEQEINLESIKNNIITNETLLKVLHNEELVINNDFIELETDYAEILELYNSNLSKSLKRVQNPLEIKTEIKKLEEDQEILKNKIQENITTADQLVLDRNEIVDNFISNYGVKPTNYIPNKKEIQTEKDKLAVANHEIVAINKQLQMTDCNNCGRPFTDQDQIKAENRKSNLIAQKEEIEKIINSKESIIAAANNEIFLINNNLDTVDNLLERDNVKLNSKIKDILIKINTLNQQIIEYNNVIQSKAIIDILSDKVAIHNITKDQLQKDLQKIKSQILTYKNKNNELNKKLKEYETKKNSLIAMEEEIRILKAYRKVVNKDGLPLYILNSKIAEINTKVNTIINQVFDFDLDFSIDENKGELKIQFNYPDDSEQNDLGLASGSETFLINLCIKVALAQISMMPKMDTIFIDEGYDSLDSDTIERLPDMFSVLIGYYRNVVTISHLDTIKDMCSKQINVFKKDKYTQIS